MYKNDLKEYFTDYKTIPEIEANIFNALMEICDKSENSSKWLGFFSQNDWSPLLFTQQEQKKVFKNLTHNQLTKAFKPLLDSIKTSQQIKFSPIECLQDFAITLYCKLDF
jgi:hypothetical protein